MKYMQRFVQQIRGVTSTWSRVLVLIWKTNPWYVTWLLVFTFLGGLVPSLQIQITSQIIQNAAEAIQGGHAPQLVHLAMLFGFLQGGLMLVSSVLGIGQQQLQSLLQTKLANAIAIQIMEKAIELDVQHFEAEIFSRLQQIAAGATTLLIAHRFSTVRMADRIIVIKQGKIIEDGTHQALLAAGGTYAHLFRLQAAGYVNP